MSHKTEISKLARKLRKQGAEVTFGAHTKVVRDGKALWLPGTLGEGRAWANMMAQLRRAGYDV